MSHLPVQYKTSSGHRSVIVIKNDAEEKAVIETVLCNLIGAKPDQKGSCLTFGPPLSDKEALVYNEGFIAGAAAAVENTIVIEPDDVKDSEGKVLVRGMKSARKKYRK